MEQEADGALSSADAAQKMSDASSLTDTGRYDEALALYEECLQANIEMGDDESEIVATAYGRIAFMYGVQKEYA